MAEDQNLHSITRSLLGLSASEQPMETNALLRELAARIVLSGTSLSSAGVPTLGTDLKFTDDTYDIGKSGATRPRDLFLSRNAVIGGTLGVTGVGTFTAQAVFTAALRTGASPIFVNDTANANMTTGLTLNQDAADDEILTLKSSDCVHGMTTLTETDTYALFKKAVAASGGLHIRALSKDFAYYALRLDAYTGAAAADTTHTAAGHGLIALNAGLKSGTDVTGAGSDQNLLTVENNTTTRFIIDAEGDTFSDGTAGTYSEWDDAMLALAYEHEMGPNDRVQAIFQEYCQYNKQSLIDAKILAPDGPNGERGFVNNTKLTKLAIGGIWQLGIALKETQARLAGVERRLG